MTKKENAAYDEREDNRLFQEFSIQFNVGTNAFRASRTRNREY